MPSLKTNTLCLALLVCLAGCSEPYQVAQVDGVLLLNGKPGNKIYIQFIPEPGANVKAPTSTATTDATGHFTLQLEEKMARLVRVPLLVGIAWCSAICNWRSPPRGAGFRSAWISLGSCPARPR